MSNGTNGETRQHPTAIHRRAAVKTFVATTRGRVVLAEFGYGGKLLPTFPTWLIDGQKPSRLAWMLKERMLPWIYWKAMLRGRELLAAPELVA